MASFSVSSKNSWLYLSARPQRPSALYELVSLGVCPLLVLLGALENIAMPTVAKMAKT